MEKNPYLVLGVDENASQEEIEKAYRELIKDYHPDSSKGFSEKVWMEITRAYKCLSNDMRRAIWDRYKEYWDL